MTSIYQIKTNAEAIRFLTTSLFGKGLLFHPLLNKGTAFSIREREEFGLIGKLPPVVESLGSQVRRSYLQFKRYEKDVNQSIYLHVLFNSNETVFYKMIKDHLAEMVGYLYTPHVSTTVKQYSLEFRHPRGIYISYDDRHKIRDIIANRTNPDVDLIVMSDGEGVLGIGDQGIGGMGIPVAKYAMYAVSGAIAPYRGIPVFLDVGTNNEQLLADPMYLGLRQPRIDSEAYFEFIDQVVAAMKEAFPHALLHWEDFSKQHARQHLARYQDQMACFNDDIQGTGVAVLAAILTALKYKNESPQEQRVVIVGAGAAGIGIANIIKTGVMRAGLSEKQALDKLWLVDKDGLLMANDENLASDEKLFGRVTDDINSWPNTTLATVVAHVKPTVLIGCSGAGGLFTQEMLSQLAKDVENPIILPLSNPSKHAEATPQDIIDWTQNKAFVATGSPFDQCLHNEQIIRVGQCNNVFAFPGIGAGMIAARATHLSDNMLVAAAEAIRDYIIQQGYSHFTIMPHISELSQVTEHVAQAVSEQAVFDKLTSKSFKEVNQNLTNSFWEPEYMPYYYIDADK